MPVVSGLYRRKPATSTASILPPSFWDQWARVELRVDVDGDQPLRLATISVVSTLGQRYHAIFKLKSEVMNSWKGDLWYGLGQIVPAGTASIRLSIRWSGGRPVAAKVDFPFLRPKLPDLVCTRVSPHFHKMELSWAYSADITSVPDLGPYEGGELIRQIDTHEHPTHPVDLAQEILTVKDAFDRAGIGILGDGVMTKVEVDPEVGDQWSNPELHDAMESSWSPLGGSYSDEAKWAAWMFLTTEHEDPEAAGIMFDAPDSTTDSQWYGTAQRQGAAVFYETIYWSAPTKTSADLPWMRRSKYFSAVHELGHVFNLIHSHEKHLSDSWIPMESEPEALSFMNYPKDFPGGEDAFFQQFRYLFSKQDLTFLRHAPENFVKMGGAAWSKNSGFELGGGSDDGRLRLSLAARGAQLEYLEPALLDLSLESADGQGHRLSPHLLREPHRMSVAIQRNDDEPKLYAPYWRLCHLAGDPWTLDDAHPLLGSLELFAGLGGWYVSEPGHYVIQACLHLGGRRNVVSSPLRFEVMAPRSPEEEILGQEYFSDRVGRFLALEGSRSVRFDAARDTVEDLVARFSDLRAAHHARFALAQSLNATFKRVDFQRDPNNVLSAKVVPLPPDFPKSRPALRALFDSVEAQESFGQVRFAERLHRHVGSLPKVDPDVVPLEEESRAYFEQIFQTRVPEQVKNHVLGSGFPTN